MCAYNSVSFECGSVIFFFCVGFSGFSMTDLIHIVQVCVCLYIGVFHPALPCVQSISVCLQMSHSPLGVLCVYVCVWEHDTSIVCYLYKYSICKYHYLRGHYPPSTLSLCVAWSSCVTSFWSPWWWTAHWNYKHYKES